MKKDYLFVLLLAIVAILALYLFTGCSNRRQVTTSDDEDSIEIAEEQPKVSDILELREELRLSKWIDSVYLAMPEQIIVAILVTEGVNKTPKQIVQTYITNKDFYDNIIKKSMDAQKEYLPDSIPRSLIPQIPLDSLSKRL